MRRKGIRLDLFICMIIAAVIFAGIWFVGDKLGVGDKLLSGADTLVAGGKDVPDGEIGGYATDDTPRISTVEELVAVAQEGKTFTVETRAVKYLNYGTFVGENYEWRILKLNDGRAMAVKLNKDKIQENDSGTHILPVGKMVLEQPGALEDMREAVSGTDTALVVDAYIDMDGEAKATYMSIGQRVAMVVINVLMVVLPIVMFVLYIVSVFAIHSIFVKKGIFSPVFPNKNAEKN